MSSSEFWCKFRLRTIFFPRIAGNGQKIPKSFFRLQKQWKWIGLRDAQWISRRSSKKHCKLRSVVDCLSSQGTLGCRLISNVFALCDILVLLSSRGTLPQVCFCHYPSASPKCPCDLWVTPKIFESSFLSLFVEKTGLSGKIFVSGLVVLYSAQSCQLLEPRCSETAFAKQRLSLTFWEHRNSFSAKFCLKLG